MAIHQNHFPYYKEIFALEGFLQDPVLVFGFQEIRIEPLTFEAWGELPLARKWKKLLRQLRRRRRVWLGRHHPDTEIPPEFRAPDVVEMLYKLGLREVETLDLFDARSTLRYDMNLPLPEKELERYGTVLDIGSLEHVFDTRQCIENCLRTLRPGGTYLLHTPVNGCYGHGFHTFNPDALQQALVLNGFEIIYQRFSTKDGAPVSDPAHDRDVSIWLAGRKLKQLDRFTIPQQGYWMSVYDDKPNQA